MPIFNCFSPQGSFDRSISFISYKKNLLNNSFIVNFKTDFGSFPQTKVLNREQTDEWKGWMQLVILIYHISGASTVSILNLCSEDIGNGGTILFLSGHHLFCVLYSPPLETCFISHPIIIPSHSSPTTQLFEKV